MSETEARGPAATPELPEEGFRLAPQQQCLWRRPGGTACRRLLALRWPGSLDDGALRSAAERVVARHEILRTVLFVPEDMSLPLMAAVDAVGPAWRDAGGGGDDTEALLDALEASSGDALDLTSGHGLVLQRVDDGDSCRLLAAAPSLLLDAVGLRLVVAEILREATGGEPEVQDESEIAQYADLAEWLHGLLEDEESAEERAFWTRLELPATHRPTLPMSAPPSRGGWAVGHHRRTLPSEIAAAIHALAEEHDSSAAVLLFVLFQHQVARLTGESASTVACRFDGRSYEELATAPGLFERYLPLAGVGGEGPLPEVLAAADAVVEEAFEVQEFFHWDAISDGDNAGSDGLACGFAYLEAFDLEDEDLEGVEVCAERGSGEPFTLECVVRETDADGGLELQWRYDRSRLGPEAVARLDEQFSTLLGATLANPERALGEHPIVGPKEFEELATLAAGPEPTHDALPVVRRLEAVAEAHPDRPAVRHGDVCWTYGEVVDRMHRVAHHLAERGLGPEDRVVLACARSADLIPALFGVWRAGAAYVTLDMGQPPGRLRSMIEAAAPALIVADAGHLDGMPEILGDAASRIPAVDLRVLFDSEGPATPPPWRDDPAGRQLAYVLFTSGSTGVPKGVAVEQRHLSAYVRATESLLDLPEAPKLASVTTLAADLGHTSIFPALVRGGELHLVPEDDAADPQRLPDHLGPHGVDGMKIVPSHLEALLGSAEQPSAVLPGQLLVLGGEASRWGLVRRARAAREGLVVYNHYGPTETTVGVVGQRLTEAPDGDGPSGDGLNGDSPVPLGRPLAGSRVRLLDPRGHAVPVGAVGEMTLGGPTVSRGYVGQPAATAERFVPDPFAASPGERLYRTGDLARYGDGGALEFLGRADQQVKIRGFRIETGDIAAALSAHPSVAEGTVMARPGPTGDLRLVAYWVAAEGHSPTVEGLREFLAQHLPEYMLPAEFVPLDALPRSANGKLQRNRLPEPRWHVDSAPFVAPRDETETLVAAAVQDLLGVDRVGAHDDFFSLGGHSLLATRLIAKLRQIFGVELRLREVFETSQIDALAQAIERARGSDHGAPPLERADRGEPIPLSFAQQRLWFLDQMAGGRDATYNMPASLRLEGTLRVDVLEAAYTEIVRRHESLRTHFVTDDTGRPWQVIREPAPVILPIDDLRDLPEAERRERLKALATEEATTPFDLAEGPLLRARLVRLGDSTWQLLQTVHHIVSDGWSTGIEIREIATFYRALHGGGTAELEPLPVQYVDYAVWQRRWLDDPGVLEQHLSFWRRYLEDAPQLLELPTDRPRPAMQSFRGARYDRILSVDPGRVHGLATERGVTPYMVYLSAYAHLLRTWSRQRDVLVGVPIANRRLPELEDMVGLFVNTLALRIDLGGKPSLAELAQRSRGDILEAFAHQDVPFERLLQDLNVERDTSHAPLVQVMLTLRNYPQERLDLPDLSLTIEPSQGQGARLDITLYLTERDGHIESVFEYVADLFDHSTMVRFAGCFERLLSAALAAPDAPLASLPLMSAQERHQVLVGWNATHRDYDHGATIHQLVLEQAERTPDATALVVGTERLTYADLSQRVLALADHLRRYGVRPEDRVGVCLHRTTRLPIVLLGTLAAGACYVPLDPNYPRDRTTFMLGDSGARFLITQEELQGILPTDLEPILIDSDGAPVEGSGPALGSVSGAPAAPVSSSQLLCLIYTSGSTGRPKAVALTHRNVVALLVWAGNMLSDAQLARPLASSSVSFDLSLFELYLPLSRGGAPVLAQNILELPFLPAKDEVTLINSVPSAIAELLRQSDLPSGVTSITLAGETFPRSLAEALFAQPGVTHVYNLYGPSEDTTHSTGGLVVQGEGLPMPIGRPIDNTQVYIVDEHLTAVPIGVPGELFLGGDGVSRGYLGRPALTAEKFVPDPFSSRPGSRMYGSGDLGRLLSDGKIDFIARVDFQVKIRGFRIELGEIETWLQRVPEVDEAVVMAREVSGEKHLVAYWSPHPGQGVAEADLRAHLAKHLPNYMIPAVLMELEALPKTPNRKINRKALPIPTPEMLGKTGTQEPGARDAGSTESRATSTLEDRLAAIWASILGIEAVGPDDNFFQLGGDSIASIQVVAQAKKIGLHLTPGQLFQNPTVAALVAVGQVEAVETDHEALVGDMPLAPVQRWFFEQNFHTPHHWNQALVLEPTQPLDPAALASALATVYDHHDALRLAFEAPATGDAGWRGAYRSPEALVERSAEWLQTIDLSDLDATAALERFAEAAEALQAQYDLGDGCPLRAALVDLGDAGQRLLLVAHHLVIDGVSWRVLIQDLAELLHAEPDAEPTLPPRSTSYRQWIERLSEWAQRPEGSAEVDFWLGQGHSRPTGADVPDSSVAEADLQRVIRILPTADAEDLAGEVGQHLRANLAELLTAAVVWGVARLTHAQRVVLDLEGHGREDLFEGVDLSRTVGWFTSLFPLAFEAPTATGDAADARVAIVQSVKDHLRAVPHRGLGFGALRYLGSAETQQRLAALAPAEVLFNYHGRPGGGLGPDAPFRLASEPTGAARSPHARRQHPLAIEAVLLDEGLRIQVAWGPGSVAGAALDAPGVERLADDIVGFLTALTAEEPTDTATTSDFPLIEMGQGKLDKLMDKLNRRRK